MIVLTKETKKITFESKVGKKITFESKVGEENTTMMVFHEGKAISDDYISKSEAFDMIQMLMVNGWEMGE